MITKLDNYKALSASSTEQLWKDADRWMSFLETSARLYKYSFKDQVMIHAQRPNAVACAEYDTWGREDIANRFVKRGSKGIALIDDSKDRTRLRYVFDFADTNARDERSKEPFFWKITDENETLVTNSLNQRFGTQSDSIDTAITELAHKLAKENGKDYLSQIETEGTFLEELDDFNVQVEFEGLLEKSVAYSLLSRCGFDTEAYLDKDDFTKLFDFNGIPAITALGTAVSELSEQALRTIERTLKDFERSKNYERNDITQNNNGERDRVSARRGNADISPEPLGNGERTATTGQIRTNEEEISQGEQEHNVSGNASRRDVGRTPDGNRQDGEGQTGQNAS